MEKITNAEYSEIRTALVPKAISDTDWSFGLTKGDARPVEWDARFLQKMDDLASPAIAEFEKKLKTMRGTLLDQVIKNHK